MNYENAVKYIHSLLRFGVSPGLERISALTEQLGNPQKKLKFVHVSGTNGKGTTCTMLSQITKAAGLKTGLFTSPYVIDFCERIQINNEFISHDELADVVTTIKEANDRLSENGIFPTEFETITAAGLLYFAQNNCDIVVLECGMGGGHDSTNIIDSPLLSVFTSISLDHMQMLGSTVSEIAQEKSGIIKPGCRVVSYPEAAGKLGFIPQSRDAAEVLKKVAHKNNCPVEFALPENASLIKSDITGIELLAYGIRLRVPFMGVHQAANALTAVCCARQLRKIGYEITDESIVEGVAQARIPARMEIFSGKPMIILDGGHNRGCAQAVHDAVVTYLSGKRIVALTALMADKECDAALSMLLPLCSAAVFTTPQNPRSCPAKELAQLAKKYCAEVYAVDDSASALEYALSLTGENDVLLICGSFYLASEVRQLLLR